MTAALIDAADLADKAAIMIRKKYLLYDASDPKWNPQIKPILEIEQEMYDDYTDHSSNHPEQNLFDSLIYGK